MIRISSLSKTYGDGHLAVDDLDLEVGPGEVYCLLGANGAGKTTTINILLNFIEASGGEVEINGIDVARRPLEAKRHVAYLADNVQLYGNFTARQNLQFFGELGGAGRLDEQRCDEILEQVGLPRKAFDQRVRGFSKGMRQKLGIAICVVKDAPALVLDEPMSGLDPKAAAELVEILRTLKEEGKAILMSTHDIFRAKELADRVGIMKDGRKVAEYTAAELRDRSLEQLYLDSMSETPAVAVA